MALVSSQMVEPAVAGRERPQELGRCDAGAEHTLSDLAYMDELSRKLESLKGTLREMESVLVAYSGGVDSTLLLRVAAETLGEKAVAVTASSEIRPPAELQTAREYAGALGAKHLVLRTDELSDRAFSSNPRERCFLCKSRLYSTLAALAREEGLAWVIDGSNVDDDADFRPGSRAADEYRVRSPLKEAALTKEEIRALSKILQLPTWDKPASPCLATRFPYGTEITKEKLDRVARAEELVAAMGLREFRVRDHGDTARIEVAKNSMHVLLEAKKAARIVSGLKRLGYTYVTLDLEGYRMGSMNVPI